MVPLTAHDLLYVFPTHRTVHTTVLVYLLSLTGWDWGESENGFSEAVRSGDGSTSDEQSTD